MKNDAEKFVHLCLYCLCTESGKSCFAPSVTRRTPSVRTSLYTSIFATCRLARTTDDDALAMHLVEWFVGFGIVHNWVSDRGRHLKNELVRLLGESFKSQHPFTLTYCRWSNGTIEVVNCELLRATRVLLAEFQMNQRCWPSVLPFVQSVLNNSVLECLGNRCPLTVFTQLPPTSALTAITRKDRGVRVVLSVDEIRMRQRSNIERTQNALDAMHKGVQAEERYRVSQWQDRHNFSEGDFFRRGVL